ncbi:hypothetical protein D3C78_1583440 [compost metagenome]
MFLRETGNAEHAAINQLGRKQDLVAILGFRIQCQDNVEIRTGDRVCVDVDIDVDRRRILTGLKRTGSTRIFEGKILDVLGKNVEGRTYCALCTIFSGHYVSSRREFVEGGLSFRPGAYNPS